MRIHNNNLHNEVGCVRNRVVMDVPRPQPGPLRQIRRLAMQLAELWRIEIGGRLTPWTMAQSTSELVRRHGRSYQGAADSLKAEPLNKRDARVSMFIKAEKWQMPGDRLKTARAIQYRSRRYNIMLARFVYPAEKALYGIWRTERSRSRVYTTKGFTPAQRFQLIAKLWHGTPDAAALCLDQSRFDAHCSAEMLEIEADVYQHLFGQGRLLRWLMQQQRHNKGKGVWGTRYRVRGCRMSGDMNTALGNTVVNALLLRWAVDNPALHIVAEGDDAVIVGPRDLIEATRLTLPGRLQQAGFECRADFVARAFADIRFCSTAPLEVSSGALALREWPKPLATDPWSVRPVSPQALPAKALTTAVCYSHLYAGLPVLQWWAAFQLSHSPRNWETGRPIRPDANYQADLWNKAREEAASRPTGWSEPSRELRAEFGLVTGIAPSEQLDIERALVVRFGPHPPWRDRAVAGWLGPSPPPAHQVD